MRLRDLTKKEYKNKIGVAIIIVAILGVAYFGLAGMQMYPSSDYGDIHIYNERTDAEMSQGDTLKVQDGDFITAWLRDDLDTWRDPQDEAFTASLMLDDGSLIEYGIEMPIAGEGLSRKWEFNLEQCLQGTNIYNIKFFVNLGGGDFITGDSFTFQITNDQPADYDDVEFINTPDANVSFGIDESPAWIEWTFLYAGSCVGTLSVDGDEVDSQDYDISGVQRIYIYNIDTSIAGIYEIEFNVAPDSDANPDISDIVQLTIGEPSTTTTTTTTTTTGTLPPPPPDPDEIDYIMIVAIVMAVIVVYAMFGRKKEK